MKVIFCGVRGTSGISSPDFLKFGGNTTCVLLEGAAGERIVLDAGTGMLEAGQRLVSEKNRKTALLLMTHYHLDHVMGFPSFAPLYEKEWNIEIASPVREGFSVRESMEKILTKPFWPLQIGTMAAGIRFTDLPGPASERPLRHGGLDARWCPVRHSEGCTAYRFDEAFTGASFVFATDIEWGESSAAEKKAFLHFCSEPRPPRVLVLDGQFTRANYEKHRGWGHSTLEETMEIASEVKAGRLFVTHHAPKNNDSCLEKIEQDLVRLMPSAKLARQGMEIMVES